MRLCLIFICLFLSSTAGAKPDEVTMRLNEFLKIYEKSKAEKEKPTVSPRHYSIASVSHKGEVVMEKEVPKAVVFDATYTIEVHRSNEWMRIPVLPAGVVLQQARLDGKEAPVVFEQNAFKLVTKKSGTFQLALKFVVPVRTQKGLSQLSFKVMPMGANRVSLTLPDDLPLEVTVVGGHDQTTSRVRGTRVVTATAPTSGNLVVRWEQKRPDAEEKRARVYSEVLTLVQVADGLLQSTAIVDQTILYAGMDTFTLQIPSNTRVIQVEGAGVRDWVTDDSDVLRVNLNYKAENQYSFMVHMEQVLGEQPAVDAPIVKPLKVERSKGWLGVVALGNLEITAGQVKEAAPVDVRTLPASILGATQNPILLGYKYVGTETHIPLNIFEHDEVDVLLTLVDQAHATTMVTGHGRRLTSVKYEVRNNRRQFLRVGLPDGAELWSAAVGGKAVQPAKSGGALLIPLLRSSQRASGLASFEIEVVFVEEGGETKGRLGQFKGRLPNVDVPVTYVAWSIFTGDELRIQSKSIDASLRHVGELSKPLDSVDALSLHSEPQGMYKQSNTGGLDGGSAPVKVRLPIEGDPHHFEKLLALDEALEVSFSYKVD